MLTPFEMIAVGLMGANGYWWARNEIRLRKQGRRWALRIVLFAFCVSAIVFPWIAGSLGHVLPPFLPAFGLLWDVLLLPFFFLTAVLLDLRAGGKWIWRKHEIGVQVQAQEAISRQMSRRRFLSTLAAVAPPVLGGGLAAVGVEQIGDFSVREVDLPVNGWPEKLRGFTIAFVSDVHVGPFCTPQMLRDVVAKANTIDNGHPADLLLYGGDLINTTLRDLPAALEMATQFKSKLGMYFCQGNHDVMDNPFIFAQRLKQAGLRLLLNEAETIEPAPGVRLQILASKWGTGDRAIYREVDRTAPLRDPTAFPIMMIHHPHGWDRAEPLGFPLILSGHTHGGQLMLTKTIGAGPLKFRYWTGIHRRNGSTLVINNGAGNWFPLRINAPAEIQKLVLRPA
ncbi:MAG TPA: metallophosphoesterase [Tepidisphaeraceae bacterium]|nr:metallophosphoesterase [Tepidisphaeraceae bacterium]